MNETPDTLLAADDPPAFTVDGENGTSPFLIVSGSDSSAFPTPNSTATLPGTSAPARLPA